MKSASKNTDDIIHIQKCKHLFVEFPGGPPLGIGDDNSIEPDEVMIAGTIIKILSPSVCLKDR
jgi:hypothetical protein